MKQRTPAERISACLQTLILDEPFYGSLALRLEYKEDNSIETMCTNGTYVKYNAAFTSSLSDKEVTGVICHEVMHCTLGHIWRRDDRCPDKWNRACDYTINEQITEHIRKSSGGRPSGSACSGSVMALPQGALLDPQYNGLSAEEIYNLLPDNGQDAGSNPCGTFTDPPEEPGDDESEAGDDTDGNPKGGAQASQNMSEGEWKVAAVQAINAQKASGQGNMPSELERIIREHITPNIPWQQHLQEFCTQVTRDDYTWKRPNSRYLHTGFTLPTLRTESLGEIIIAIDTSGSVSDLLLARFLSEIQSLLNSAKPKSITLMSCDYSLHNIQSFTPGQDLTSYVPKGGGGTAFEPVFDYIEDEQPNPLCLIYFTDGEGSFPSTPPNYPTLWLHFGRDNFRYPFGSKIEIPPLQAK